MKSEKLATFEEALEAGKKLPWVLVRSLSEVTVEPAAPKTVDQKELLEAHFFGGSEYAVEIRIYRYDGELHFVRLAQEPEDDVLEEKYRLRQGGGTVTIRHILNDDRSEEEDGQLCRAVTLLTGWKEGEN